MWLVYAISSSVMWGLVYTLAQALLKAGISIITLLSLELLIGGIGGIFLFAFKYTKVIHHDIGVVTHNTSLLSLLAITIVISFFANLLILLSIQAKNATVAGLIEIAYPIFIILFSWLLFNENYFNVKVLLGGLLIFAGVLTITFS